MNKKLSCLDIKALKNQRRIVSVTAYDFYGARLSEEAGVDFILVGDSLGTVIQGHDSTLKVTLDHMLYHTQIVTRGAPDTFVVADMPYLSFHISPEETVRNAAQLITEGSAGAVKIEGAHPKRLEMIEACLTAEIPVMGHIGLTPQSHHVLGGYKVQEDRERLLQEAEALEKAGVFATVLEAVPMKIAEEVTASISIPTIGIGAGPQADGQIIVFHDVLGWHNDRMAKFVKSYENLWDKGVKGLSQYVDDVKEGKYPDAEHAYRGKQKAKAEA